MVTFSPQTVATGSLALLLAGLGALGLISVVLPSADLFLGLAVLIAGLGATGLLFAYYYATVLVWDAGNRAGAVALLAGPVVLAQLFVSGISLTDSVGIAYQIGRIGLIQIIVVAAAALWFGSLLKRTAQEDYLPDLAALPPPSTPVLGVCALFLTGILWFCLLPPL